MIRYDQPANLGMDVEAATPEEAIKLVQAKLDAGELSSLLPLVRLVADNATPIAAHRLVTT